MNDKIVITEEADELTIELKNGKVIDLENSDLSVGKIVFKKKEKELPTKWEDLKKLKGYYVNDLSEIFYLRNANMTISKNLFPTKAEAEACLALSQLCQLRDAYNGEPLADWCDWADDNTKYCIEICDNRISKDYYSTYKKVLAFKTEELRDKFVENFEELILTAKPLL